MTSRDVNGAMTPDLETRFALHDLIHRSNRAYETHRYDELVDYFTEDAHYRSNSRGETAGRAALLEMMRKRPANRLARHIISNIMIDVLGPDEARGFCYVAAFINYDADADRISQGPVPQIGPPAVAEYSYRFRKIGGDWKIAEKITTEIFWGMTIRP
jgi:hypothetical protein